LNESNRNQRFGTGVNGIENNDWNGVIEKHLSLNFTGAKQRIPSSIACLIPEDWQIIITMISFLKQYDALTISVQKGKFSDTQETMLREVKEAITHFNELIAKLDSH
jgi:hypothetical protein